MLTVLISKKQLRLMEILVVLQVFQKFYFDQMTTLNEKGSAKLLEFILNRLFICIPDVFAIHLFVVIFYFKLQVLTCWWHYSSYQLDNQGIMKIFGIHHLESMNVWWSSWPVITALPMARLQAWLKMYKGCTTVGVDFRISRFNMIKLDNLEKKWQLKLTKR